MSLYASFLDTSPRDKDLSGIAHFEGDEFHIWKWQIREFLMYKKLFGVLDGTDLESAVTD
jgi:hypothetical protein